MALVRAQANEIDRKVQGMGLDIEDVRKTQQMLGGQLTTLDRKIND